MHFFNICMKNQQIHQLFIQFINYVWKLLHVSALHCHLQGAFLVPSEKCSAHHVTRHNTPIHNILSTAPQLRIFQKALGTLPEDGVVLTAHHVSRHNTPTHNILSTAPQLSISQKVLGMLPEDGNVMPKHVLVGAAIH